MDKEKLMAKAIKLALKAKGLTSPNPLVGCVIYKNGEIIGEGFHRRAGEPHAEIEALRSANWKVKGAKMFVTLEPCIHYGKTPPCAPQIVKAGIKEVYIAMKDPNPRVNGKGIEYLSSHGVKVYTGILEDRARKMNKFYIFSVKHKRPYVILKIASTLDGFIWSPGINERYITCEKSRKLVHKWRNEIDAVLVGIGTILKDNPSLNVRLVKPRKQPIKVILDSSLKLPQNANILKTDGKTIVFSSEMGKINGAEIIKVRHNSEGLNLEQILKKLYSLGVNSVLVEGGKKVFTSFIKYGLFQEIKIFYSPFLAGEGIKMIDGVKSEIKIEKIKKIDRDILVEGENVHRDY